MKGNILAAAARLGWLVVQNGTDSWCLLDSDDERHYKDAGLCSLKYGFLHPLIESNLSQWLC